MLINIGIDDLCKDSTNYMERAEKRFWDKVDKTPGHGPNGDCWLWTGFIHEKGYGYFKFLRKSWAAHRFSYGLHFDDFIETACVCHACDNRPCVNPSHLWMGSHYDNVHDKINKGRERHPFGEDGSGAILTEQNVIEIRNSGIRQVDIAEHYGVTQATISLIRRGKTWRHLL